MPCFQFTQGNIIKSVLTLKCIVRMGGQGGLNTTLRETATYFKLAPLLFLIKAKRRKGQFTRLKDHKRFLCMYFPLICMSLLSHLCLIYVQGGMREKHKPLLIMSSCYAQNSLIHASTVEKLGGKMFPTWNKSNFLESLNQVFKKKKTSWIKAGPLQWTY